MPKDTREFTIPCEGSTAEEGEALQVISNSHGTTLQNVIASSRSVFVEPGQVRRLIRVLEEIDAERQARIDQHHRDEHALGAL